MARHLEDDGIWCQVMRPKTAAAFRGRAAGLAGGVHVLTVCGAQERSGADELATDRFRVLSADSVAASLDFHGWGFG